MTVFHLPGNQNISADHRDRQKKTIGAQHHTKWSHVIRIGTDAHDKPV
jgi:hypothetical protein